VKCDGRHTCCVKHAHARQETWPAARLVDMKTQNRTGQEEATMKRRNLRIRLALGLVALVAALVLVSSAPARVPVEPGPGSPVTQGHLRQPAKQHVKRATRRTAGGFPAVSGVHVRNAAEARTE
jgi:hypothetical protein